MLVILFEKNNQILDFRRQIINQWKIVVKDFIFKITIYTEVVRLIL